jgi:arginine decarboxylase
VYNSDFVPERMFFTKGIGAHEDQLVSFELALRDARIAPYNLVSVSSIMPPNVLVVPVEKGVSSLRPGQIVFAVLARNSCKEFGRIFGSAVGSAKPLQAGSYGYLTEVHKEGLTEQEMADWAEDSAAEMLASTYGITISEGDWDRIWNQKLDRYTIGNRPVETSSTVCVTTGVKDKWVTTVAAAVFVF